MYVCVCTPWRVYPTHTRSVEGGRGLLDLSHADKNCIMGLIGLLGPGLNFRYFSRVPGQTSRERERKREARPQRQQASRALSTSTDLLPFFTLPPFLLSSLHSAFCSTAAKSIDPAGHARPAAPHFDGGGGASIVREIFETKGRNNAGSLSPPSPFLLDQDYYLSLVASRRSDDPFFFPPPLGLEFLFFFNKKRKEVCWNKFGEDRYEERCGKEKEFFFSSKLWFEDSRHYSKIER